MLEFYLCLEGTAFTDDSFQQVFFQHSWDVKDKPKKQKDHKIHYHPIRSFFHRHSVQS